MALHTRQALYGLTTGIDTRQLTAMSRLVSACSGMVVQPNKAVVGANAFAHESGIHQDGMLKHTQTYEIMTPEAVGVKQTSLVMGKHSGRHAFVHKLEELGYKLGSNQIEDAFVRFKALADRKKQILDADLEALVAEELDERPTVALEGLQVACGTMGLPTATVRLRGGDGVLRVRAAVGSGPIDAACKAIEQALDMEVTLVDYVVHAVTPGLDALGEVSVRVRGADGRVVHGRGADTDVIVASARAYLAAVTRLAARAVAA